MKAKESKLGPSQADHVLGINGEENKSSVDDGDVLMQILYNMDHSYYPSPSLSSSFGKGGASCGVDKGKGK